MMNPGHKSGHKKKMGDLGPRISIKSGISQAINEDGQLTSEKHSRVYFQRSSRKKSNIWKKFSAIGPYKMPEKNFIIEKLGSKQRFQLLYLS